MTDRIKIAELQFDYPQVKVIGTHLGQDLTVKQYLPLEEKIELIQRVMNMCAGNGTFCNPVKVKVLTELEMVMAYSNIEIDNELLGDDVYKVYDYLTLEGIIANVLYAIDASEREFIQSSCWETSEKLTDFNNSLIGALTRLNEESAFNNLNLDELIEQVKDPALAEFIKNFKESTLGQND